MSHDMSHGLIEYEPAAATCGRARVVLSGIPGGIPLTDSLLGYKF